MWKTFFTLIAIVWSLSVGSQPVTLTTKILQQVDDDLQRLDKYRELVPLLQSENQSLIIEIRSKIDQNRLCMEDIIKLRSQLDKTETHIKELRAQLKTSRLWGAIYFVIALAEAVLVTVLFF